MRREIRRQTDRSFQLKQPASGERLTQKQARAETLALQQTVGNQALLQRALNPSQAQENSNAGKVYVTNNSNTTIYYKPEEGSAALPIGPKGKSGAPIDGVATHKYKYHVFKVVTGSTVTVDEDGDVDADYTLPRPPLSALPPLPVGDLINAAGGGWKNKKWLEGRHKADPPDYGWDALFEKAASIKAPGK